MGVHIFCTAHQKRVIVSPFYSSQEMGVLILHSALVEVESPCFIYNLQCIIKVSVRTRILYGAPMERGSVYILYTCTLCRGALEESLYSAPEGCV